MPTVGEELKLERENQGLTLNQIEEITSIRIKYLDSIENGDFTSLPGEVYVKGFIRNYAIALGFDGSAFVEKYKLEMEEQSRQLKADTNVNSDIEIQEKKNLEIKVKTPTPLDNGNIKRKVRILPLLIFITAFCVMVGIGVYIVLAVFYPSDSSSANNSSISGKPAIIDTKNPGNVNKEDKNEKKDNFRLLIAKDGKITIVPEKGENIDNIIVEAEFVSKCWTNVVADNKEAFTGVLNKGDKKSWTAKEQIVLKLGDAAAVTMSINGKKVDKLGEKGQVIETNITILK